MSRPECSRCPIYRSMISDGDCPTCLADDETRFPYLNQHIRKDYPIITEAIDEWFKRCLEDYPYWEDHPEWGMVELVGAKGQWFERWFGQFKKDK